MKPISLVRDSTNPAFRRLGGHVWSLIMAVAVIGVYTAALHCPEIYRSMGVGIYEKRWFIDTLSVLVSSDYSSLGADPMVANRVAIHLYSRWWFVLSDLGVTGADAAWLGLSMMAVWILCAIRTVNPKTWWMALIGFLIIVSPALQLGVNRGNVDLLLFALMMPLPWLLTASSRGWRWLAPVLLAICTGLKYYPLLAAPIVFFGTGGRRMTWWLSLVTGVLLTGVLVDVLPDYFKVSGIMPTLLGMCCIGRGQLFHLMAVPEKWVLPCTLIIFALFSVFWWRVKLDVSEHVTSRKTPAFVMGATVLLGCFIITENYSYRFVFSLFLLPLLWGLLDQTSKSRTRLVAQSLVASLLIVVWTDGLLGLFIVSAFRRDDMELMNRFILWSNWIVSIASWVFMFLLTGFMVAIFRSRLPHLFPAEKRDDSVHAR
jgi:hypothetical protein